jgi:flagellar biosynthesis protein FlhF
MLSRVLVQTTPGSPVREFGPLAAQLHAVEMPAALIGDLLEAVERRLGLRHRAGAASPQALRRALAGEIASRLAVSPGAGAAGAARRIVALAGPPGSGKTTTIAKLAMRLGVETHTPTLIVSADSYRIAAAEQLRTYAAILGVPFQLAETPGALARTLEENRHKDLVFIDTPGFGEGDSEVAAEWSSALTRDPSIETQLVLSAAMRTSALEEAIGRFGPWRPSRLVLTGLDMTRAAGGALGAAMAARLPVAWLGTGQSVPEDLEPATPARLEAMLLGAAASARSAAA